MLAHILALPGFKECTSIQEYVHKTQMKVIGNWGIDIQLLCFEHFTNTCVFTYKRVQSNWYRFGPHNMDRNLPVNVTAYSVYLCLKADHYDLYMQNHSPKYNGHIGLMYYYYTTIPTSQPRSSSIYPSINQSMHKTLVIFVKVKELEVVM